ncbi:MAG: aminoacyl-tRNA hydrolase [Oscillospiraceae bacterium]|nr:aminoacyl-tRNA hydrolase [Oscillospiraceae bacterium]
MNIFKKNHLEKWLVVGLGNPGIEYKNTRHNAGFSFIDSLSIGKFKNKFKSCLAECKMFDQSLIFLKPQTFMNLSGESAKQISEFYKISINNFVVIFDDISLPIGKIRIRKNGSHGGHNGVKNIIDLLKTNDFKRIKIGVGEKPIDWELKDWVLSKFSSVEEEILKTSFENVSSALKLIVNKNITNAMNKFN